MTRANAAMLSPDVVGYQLQFELWRGVLAGLQARADARVSPMASPLDNLTPLVP